LLTFKYTRMAESESPEPTVQLELVPEPVPDFRDKAPEPEPEPMFNVDLAPTEPPTKAARAILAEERHHLVGFNQEYAKAGPDAAFNFAREKVRAFDLRDNPLKDYEFKAGQWYQAKGKPYSLLDVEAKAVRMYAEDQRRETYHAEFEQYGPQGFPDQASRRRARNTSIDALKAATDVGTEYFGLRRACQRVRTEHPELFEIAA
jgi:hypothetical protein